MIKQNEIPAMGPDYMRMLSIGVASFEGSHTISTKVCLRSLFARNARKAINTERLDRIGDRCDDCFEE